MWLESRDGTGRRAGRHSRRLLNAEKIDFRTDALGRMYHGAAQVRLYVVLYVLFRLSMPALMTSTPPLRSLIKRTCSFKPQDGL